ncbi:MAG: hypothetical protein R2720_08660 [Candidatus Nanopelagicales bacterium]
MQITIANDHRVHPYLQALLPIRHAHLRPLLAVGVGARRITLHYGRPGPCLPDCTGVEPALRAIHDAGLWVGDLVEAVGLDDVGRVVLNGVGSKWELHDPFAGHPATRGEFDLRIAWRQRGDLLQLSRTGSMTRCDMVAS